MELNGNGDEYGAMGTVTKLFFADVVVGRLCASVMQCMWFHVDSGQGGMVSVDLASHGKVRV